MSGNLSKDLHTLNKDIMVSFIELPVCTRFIGTNQKKKTGFMFNASSSILSKIGLVTWKTKIRLGHNIRNFMILEVG